MICDLFVSPKCDVIVVFSPTSPATPTLQDLSNELNSVTDWHSLGVKLGVQSFVLSTIEKNHHGDSVRCKHEMLVRWLRSTKLATWKGVADALWQMEERTVAVNIQIKYCSSSTDTGIAVVLFFILILFRTCLNTQ